MSKKVLVCLLKEAEREVSRCGAASFKLGQFSRPGLIHAEFGKTPGQTEQHITQKTNEKRLWDKNRLVCHQKRCRSLKEGARVLEIITSRPQTHFNGALCSRIDVMTLKSQVCWFWNAPQIWASRTARIKKKKQKRNLPLSRIVLCNRLFLLLSGNMLDWTRRHNLLLSRWVG